MIMAISAIDRYHMWKSRKFRSQSLCQTQNHRTSMKNDQVQYESAQKSHQLAWKMSKSSMYQLKIISTSMKNCKVDDVPAIFHDDPSKSQIWVHDRWPHQNSCPSAWWTHFWSMDQLIWCRFHDESVFNIADQHSTAINLMRSTRFEFRTMSWWWVGWWSSMWVDEIEVKFQFDANFYFQVGMKFIKMRSMHSHRHLLLQSCIDWWTWDGNQLYSCWWMMKLRIHPWTLRFSSSSHWDSKENHQFGDEIGQHWSSLSVSHVSRINLLVYIDDESSFSMHLMRT